jgi:hypothetical protein
VPRRSTLALGAKIEATVRPPKYKDAPLRATWHELKRGTFLGNAQARSSRRKSPWNLLLLLVVPVWLSLFIEGLRLAKAIARMLMHGRTIPHDLIWPVAVAPIFTYFPILIAAVPTAMALVNFLIYFLVPPARRAMDAEDKAVPGTEYAVQQPLMVKIALLMFPIALLLSVIGQIFL